jgi:peptidyl-prolyl cis-trans isomerase C
VNEGGVLIITPWPVPVCLEALTAKGDVSSQPWPWFFDPQSRERGGMTDWVNAADLSPALIDAVKASSKGQLLAKPIKTDAGWHVLQVEDLRAFKAPALADTRPQLLTIVARLALDARLKTLRQQAKIQ